MANQYTDAAFAQKAIGGVDKLILWVICQRTDNDEGTCYPSYRVIAEDSGICRRSCIQSVSLLTRLGVVPVTSKGGRSKELGNRANTYKVDLKRMGTVTPAEVEAVREQLRQEELAKKELKKRKKVGGSAPDALGSAGDAPRGGGALDSPQVVQEMHHRGALDSLPVVQEMHPNSPYITPHGNSTCLTQVSEGVREEGRSVASLPPSRPSGSGESTSTTSPCGSKSNPPVQTSMSKSTPVPEPEGNPVPSELETKYGAEAENLFQTLYPASGKNPEKRQKYYPVCLEIVELCREYGACNILDYNRTHKSGALYFKRAPQMLHAVKSGDILDQYVAHDPETCRTCKKAKSSAPAQPEESSAAESSIGENHALWELAQEVAYVLGCDVRSELIPEIVKTLEQHLSHGMTADSIREVLDTLWISRPDYTGDKQLPPKVKELARGILELPARVIVRELPMICEDLRNFQTEAPDYRCHCGYEATDDYDLLAHQQGCLEYLAMVG
jgi:hypothetical protein